MWLGFLTRSDARNARMHTHRPCEWEGRMQGSHFSSVQTKQYGKTSRHLLGPDLTLGLCCQEIGLLSVLFLSIAVFTEVNLALFSTIPAEMTGLLNKKAFQFVIALLKRCGELGIMLTWLVANDFLVGGPPHVDLQCSVFFLEDTISSWWGSPARGGVDIRGSKVASWSRKATGKDPLL